MTKPAELLEAELVDGLCQRWGVPPSVVLQEDAGYILQMMATLAAARKPGGKGT